METLPQPCGAEVDSAVVRSRNVRGRRLTLGGRSYGWMRSFMVSPLQPVFVFRMLQTRLPGGKVRRGPAGVALESGRRGMVVPTKLIPL